MPIDKLPIDEHKPRNDDEKQAAYQKQREQWRELAPTIDKKPNGA